MSTPPVVLFVVDAGERVGGGHVMRSLSLARALEARGADCAFVAPPPVAEVLETFTPDMARRTAAGAFDAVVFDHYGFGRDHHRALAKGRPVLVIDDLADRPLGADLVLDSGPARIAADYAPWVEPNTQLLLGPAYAPVRAAFAERRSRALARRSEPVRRILISLGLTDVGGMTGRVLEAIGPALGDLAVDVAVGGGAPSLGDLKAVAQADRRISLHVDTQAMAELTTTADLAIGAAGSTTWERCTLGLASVLVVVAENQRGAAQAMAERGAALVVDAADADFAGRMVEAFETLKRDAALRQALSRASAQVCDGQGAGRVAEVLLGLMGA